MQTYDFLMLAILVGMTLFGFAKGLAWQVAYFSSFIVSYFVALNFSDELAPMFGKSEQFNRLAAMLVIYVATSFGIWMAFRAVASAIDRVKLKEFDRQMGALVGFARGALWCIAITFFAATLLESQRDAILGSRAGHYIAVVLNNTQAVVPAEIHEVIRPYVDRIRSGIDPNQPAPQNPFDGFPMPGQGGEGTPWGGQSNPSAGGTQTTPWGQPTAPPSAPTWGQPQSNPLPWGQQPAPSNPPAWPSGNRSASQGSGTGNNY